MLNDGIDTSEHLDAPFAALYPHRASKGDLSMNEGVISYSDTGFMVDEMLCREYINEDQHKAAVFVITLRNVAFSKMGYAKMREQIVDLSGNDAQVTLSPIFLYSRLMRAMNPKNMGVVTTIIGTPSLAWAWHTRYEIRNSLDELKKVIDEYFASCKNDNHE